MITVTRVNNCVRCGSEGVNEKGTGIVIQKRCPTCNYRWRTLADQAVISAAVKPKPSMLDQYRRVVKARGF